MTERSTPVQLAPHDAVQIETDNSADEYLDAHLVKILFRCSQISADRLAEYLLGVDVTDEKIVERINSDKERFRMRYDLPDRRSIAGRYNEYEHELRRRIGRLGVTHRELTDTGTYLERSDSIGGVYFDDTKTIAASIDRSNEVEYRYGIKTLEHEYLHAVQFTHSPRMPIEEMEYQAYAINAKRKVNPHRFFDSVWSSVDAYHEYLSEKQGAPLLPQWNTPEYFLEHIDKIDLGEKERAFVQEVTDFGVARLLEEAFKIASKEGIVFTPDEPGQAQEGAANLYESDYE